MQKFEIRLAEQHRRNRNHLINLDRFFNSERFGRIPREQQDLMIEEFQAMERLDAILVRRMELLGIPCN